MAARSTSRPPIEPRPFLCRCGHLPTHHMVVAPIGATSSFRLDPTGACALCGAALCARFAPGPGQP
ncbi:MAG: hypothetical protein ACYCPN_01125 [Thermoplasmata archaeon]